MRGTASCANWDCTGANGAWYGRFDVAWPKLITYLNPVNPTYCSPSAGSLGNGSIGNPIDRAVDGSFAVIEGSDLVLNAGTYNQEFTTRRAMTIHSLGGSAVIR